MIKKKEMAVHSYPETIASVQATFAKKKG